MSGEQRVIIALKMSEYARQFRKIRIREEHPHWSERQVIWEIIRLSFLPDPLPEWLQEKRDEEWMHESQ